MLRGLRRHLSYANVMATAAVFLALGGSATAALVISGKNVRDGSLSGADIRDNSISSADIKNGDLRSADFKAGQAPGGPAGPTGPAGATGPAGTPGATGPKGDGAGTTTTLFATVGATGTLVHGSGVTNVAHTIGGGIYSVYFDRDVSPSKCAAVADGGNTESGGANVGAASVVPYGPFAVVPDDYKRIDVYVRTLNGSVALIDAPFHLIVVC